MSTHARLLGFAFANADFLFEVDAQGMIVFGAGASGEFAAGSVQGKPATSLFDGASADAFRDLVRKLPAGERRGPVALKAATGADANLSLFRLAENHARISCTLSRATPRPVAARDPATGLRTR